MTERKWKYRREDFGELPVVLHHLTIHLNFLEAFVEACNTLEMTARTSMERLELDANSLEIVRVEAVSGPEVECGKGAPLSYEYQTDRNKLIVLAGRTIPEGERFRIRTITRCTPSDHILEGIYKDVTPPGAPQQYISQCQQWGFQRIMPIFDDCRAKCTMRTTIEADAAYTHLISNGNIDRTLNPAGRPVPKPGAAGRQVITFDNPTPMAPYLFLVCAGTWEVLADEVVYDTGRRVRLEYLVPPGSVEGARVPMQILKESVLWIKQTQDYEYTGDTYRTICMSKSNFGGMENVGNTTIVTDAALIHGHTLDASLLYAHAVIVHEFEHNQCGSETTMDTPFDVWLNEAYTVDVERLFMADMFDPGFVRLNQLESIRNPLLGPLAIEDAGHAGRIVREGFNDPDELIDGVTYVKAAEVIRMLRLVIGDDCFKAGKALYFTRYRHGNATTDQFFQCFEETSGVSLEQFKKGWLYTIGYPGVTARGEYDPVGRRFHVQFRQNVPEGLKPFHLPIDLALLDEQGRDMPDTGQVFQMKDFEAELVIEDVAVQPAFASINRNASFYGTFRDGGATPESLREQARRDPNPCNRLEAMRQLTDWERIKLLEHTAETINPDWLVLYGQIIEDRALPAALKAYFLRIDEQPLDREYVASVRELVLAREKLMLTVNLAYRDRLLALFSDLDTYTIPADASPRYGIDDRLLKQVLLDLITVDDSPESHQLILEHFRRATMANDRVAALLALNRSSSPARRPLMEEVYKNWVGHLSGYANYLRVVSSGTCDDVFDRIAQERSRPTFDVNIPTWSRALFLPMAANNKMVWTDRGIQWLVATVIELAPVNATTTSRLLNTFQHVNRLKPELRQKVTASLERILQEVSETASPTIYGQARAYLGR